MGGLGAGQRDGPVETDVGFLAAVDSLEEGAAHPVGTEGAGETEETQAPILLSARLRCLRPLSDPS